MANSVGKHATLGEWFACDEHKGRIYVPIEFWFQRLFAGESRLTQEKLRLLLDERPGLTAEQTRLERDRHLPALRMKEHREQGKCRADPCPLCSAYEDELF